MKRKRSEILNKLADCILELDEVREQLRLANKNAVYWYERYTELEGNAHVQGVRDVAASAGVPGSTGNGADNPV